MTWMLHLTEKVTSVKFRQMEKDSAGQCIDLMKYGTFVSSVKLTIMQLTSSSPYMHTSDSILSFVLYPTV